MVPTPGVHDLQDHLDHGSQDSEALADRVPHYKLAGLMEMDDAYFGVPKPSKRGRGAGGKVKAVVAVETPENKPRFVAMCMVPRVSGEEIQTLVRERLAAEVVVKTDDWQGYSVLDGSPGRHEWLVLGSGKEAVKVLPWVHTLIANINRDYGADSLTSGKRRFSEHSHRV